MYYTILLCLEIDIFNKSLLKPGVMRLFMLLFSSILIVSSCNSQEISNKDEQIAQAVMAAAEKDRAEATVYGYDNNGKLVTLKKGSNQIICLADNPAGKSYNVACYHQKLDEFMERGRVLRAGGKTNSEIFDIREEEVKAGKLSLPENSTLSVLYGKVDEETGKPIDLKIRYVVYIPFATSASTGLPESPVVPGAPWIMDPGTHRAHIMVNPQQ